MLPHITHDGYTEYEIPLALQDEIDAVDTIAASAEAKRVPHDNDNLIIYRYPDDPGNGTRKETFRELVNVFYPMVADWPGKEDVQFEWKFNDIQKDKEEVSREAEEAGSVG
ncbi:hypothetical protein Forpe1208_v016181 [Fusarium oxysporum f. sp. rapae]|uniref:Uncharacterized protein n=1 Tax=Fusarium oxysporum f. sp. rapae TaxID=485398 RepID=A0A8J5NGK3_FUSOX|nr:hypothetical protein Forpe1208_v016181 [Fusarium oxysporum f. sp. rapae]